MRLLITCIGDYKSAYVWNWDRKHNSFQLLSREITNENYIVLLYMRSVCCNVMKLDATGGKFMFAQFTSGDVNFTVQIYHKIVSRME